MINKGQMRTCCSTRGRSAKSRKSLVSQRLTRKPEDVSVQNWGMGRSIADPSPYSRWTDAVYAALDQGDSQRVRQLGWLCAHLIDLSLTIPQHHWEELHVIVSRGVGVLPPLALADDARLPLSTWLMERLAAELLRESRRDPLPPFPGGPIA